MATYEGRFDGKPRRIGIACSRTHDSLTERLLAGAWDALIRHGVAEEGVDVVWVPGLWELPIVAERLCGSGRYDGVVALAVAIDEERDTWGRAALCLRGLQQVALGGFVPVSVGLVHARSLDAAAQAVSTTAVGPGASAVMAVLEQIDLTDQLGSGGSVGGQVGLTSGELRWSSQS